MYLVSKIKKQLEYDFDLDQDDCLEIMGAVVKLFNNTTFDNHSCNQVTKDLVTIAINYGQPTVGGSRCDYAVSDLLNAVEGHYRITNIKPDYVEFLQDGIDKYALNSSREKSQLSLTLKQLGN